MYFSDTVIAVVKRRPHRKPTCIVRIATRPRRSQVIRVVGRTISAGTQPSKFKNRRLLNNIIRNKYKQPLCESQAAQRIDGHCEYRRTSPKQAGMETCKHVYHSRSAAKQV